MMKIEKALIIKKEWLDLILSDKKTLEIRGSNSKIRGKIGLIESGSGLIKGECQLINSIKIDEENIQEILKKGCIPTKDLIYSMYKNPYAWVLESAIRYEEPLKYNHPQGAIIWINIKN